MKLVRNNAVMLGCMVAFLVVMLIIGLRISATSELSSQAAGPTAATGNGAANPNPQLERDDPERKASSWSPPSVDQIEASKTTTTDQVAPKRSTRLAEAKNALVTEDLAGLVSKSESIGKEVAAINSQLSDLSSNEAGRRLGQAHDLLESFIKYQDRITSTAKLYDTTRRQLVLFQAEMEEQLELYPTTAISDSLLSQMKTLGDSIDEIAAELRDCKLMLSALVSEAAKHPVGEKSLAEQLENYLVDKQKLQIQAVTEERKRLDQAAIEAQLLDEQKLAEAREVLRQEKVAAERALVEAEREAARMAAEERQRQVLLEAEFERDWPKIQRYLGPLFVKTTKQPGGSGLIETKESKAVSLTGLKALGLSNPDVEKACRTLLIFFSYYKAGERGQGPYPSYYAGGALNPGELTAIRPAYDLLDKYGELLVKKGLLAE